MMALRKLPGPSGVGGRDSGLGASSLPFIAATLLYALVPLPGVSADESRECPARTEPVLEATVLSTDVDLVTVPDSDESETRDDATATDDNGTALDPDPSAGTDGAISREPSTAEKASGPNLSGPTLSGPRPEPPVADVPPESGDFRVKKAKVYYGDSSKFSTPAVVAAAKVYDRIPAYRTIVEKGFSRDDPEYWPLMRKASKAFVRGLRTVCRRGRYDLVGEVGSIEPRKKGIAAVPDITSRVIGAVGQVLRPLLRSEGDDNDEAAQDDASLDDLVNFPDL